MTDSILIIGEPALKKELISALTEASLVVAGVPSYPEALLKLDEFKPDMVIMDTDLPGTDSWTACSELRQALGVPIVLMGRDSGGKAWKRAVEAGADLYLKKPFSCRELVARVKAILRRYKLSTSRSGNGR